MEFTLTDEQELLKKTVREFVEKELPGDYVNLLEEDGRFPDEVWHKMADIGLLGLPFPEEFGGVEGSVLDQAIVVEGLAWAMTSMAHMYIMSTLFGGKSVLLHGSQEQKENFLPAIIQGKIKFCMSLTEPNAGSDVAALSTQAVLDGDYFVVNGSKIFSTGAHLADFILLAARTSKESSKHRGISYLIIDAHTPGIKVSPLKHLGCMAVHTDEVSYEDVRVPRSALLGEMGQGWAQILSILELERIFTAAAAVGLAQKAFEDAVVYARERQQFGRPIGKFQAISHMLAEAATELEAIRLLTYLAAWMKDNNIPCFKEASMAKLKATEVTKEIALRGVQIMGGYGYMMEYDMQRYLREAVVGTIFGGTSQIQKNIIAGEMGL